MSRTSFTSASPPKTGFSKTAIKPLLNLLHVTPYYAPAYPFGGVVRAVEGMARALTARGHQVTVLTTDALDPQRRIDNPVDETVDGIDIVRARNWLKRGTLNLSTPFNIRQLAPDLVSWADVIHCHEFRTVENLLVTPLARKAGKPLVLSPHGTLSHETGRGAVKAAWDALFSRAMARRFNTVIGLTQTEAEETRAFWSEWSANNTHFAVVPNGVNAADFEHLPGRESFRQQYGLGDSVVCLFMGRLHPRKGPQLLAQAFIQAKVSNARLVIAGPDEGALALIQPYMDERIVLTGYLDGTARLAALAAADVFALPAVGEGLSMALLEAMAVGLPVLITPGCNLPEAAASGAGLEVERAVSALSAGLQTLLSDADARLRMSAAARRLVRERFTWDAVAAHLETVYEATLNSQDLRS